MIYPSIDSLLKQADSPFALCIIIGKRARQLVNGAQTLSNCNSQNAVTNAVNETNESKLSYVHPRIAKITE